MSILQQYVPSNPVIFTQWLVSLLSCANEIMLHSLSNLLFDYYFK